MSILASDVIGTTGASAFSSVAEEIAPEPE
jgi:hypothetical protein